MTANIDIVPVSNRAERRVFACFPWQVYREDPYWVPPIMSVRMAYLEKQTAFFESGEGDFFLARRPSGEVLGTIGLAIDHVRNQHMNEQSAVFGFFDVLADSDAFLTASKLWEYGAKWCREKGMALMKGPYNFASTDEPGFVIEGYDSPPTLLMAHTPPAYAKYAQRYGFVKYLDTLAYRVESKDFDHDPANIPTVIRKVAGRARNKLGHNVVRSVQLKDWEAEVEHTLEIYNRSMSVHKDFVPLERVQWRQFARQMRAIVDPELILIAEVNNHPVGFLLCLPNFNEALLYADGLRSPLGYVKMLWNKRSIKGASIKIIAVTPEYWARGIEAILIDEISVRIAQKGYSWVDASFVMENHPVTHKIVSRFGFKAYKRFRIYQLPIQ